MPTTFWGWVLFLGKTYGASFLRGAGISVYLAVLGTFFGCIIGLLAGIVQTMPDAAGPSGRRRPGLPLAKLLLKGYVGFFRGTPMMVQAMVIYYGASQYLGATMDPLAAGLLIVSINTGAYMAETVRGGILSVDPGQTEGAMAVGMGHFRTMVSVVLPQALRNIIPQIGNTLVGNIKDTSVLSVIAVNELFYKSRSACGTYFKYFEVFFITCCIYLVLTTLTNALLHRLEKAMDGPQNYQLAPAPNAGAAPAKEASV